MNEYFKEIGDATNRSGPVSFAWILIFRLVCADPSVMADDMKVIVA